MNPHQVGLLVLLALPSAWAQTEPLNEVLRSASEQTRLTTGYDPAYVRIPYPGGDVPIDRGVCTDVIVRAFRKAGVDLQVIVHEDMKRAFDAYPQLWGLRRPDPNIDHRRVPNLMTFFKRQGKSLPLSAEAARYFPGDVVVWKLPDGPLHIGLVTNKKSADSTPLLAHNIGAGARLENVLFSWKIIGHYRWFEP